MLCSALSLAAAAAAAALTLAAGRTITRSAAEMSANGDVVCWGWLIKSPPEKKLKRFAWRKRWFVLRRGRMSGDPDVLEYYQSKSSRKPIRAIDLRECEVERAEMLDGPLRVKRDLQEKHLFVVRTSARVFYLVAKTQEERNSWISSISQICHFGSLTDPESSEEGLPPTPTSLQPPPDTSDRASLSSQGDSTQPPDYLFLSECETRSTISCRHSSFSFSEASLEQRSADDAARDVVPSPFHADSSSSTLATFTPDLFAPGRPAHPPFSAPCSSVTLSSSSSSASSVFLFDKPYPLIELSGERQTPPPLPPKPNQQADEGLHHLWASVQPLQGRNPPRRTSLSSLDHLKIGEPDIRLKSSRRQSLNLPFFSIPWVQSQTQDDSYVPMSSSSSTPPLTPESDGYIPMSPATLFPASCSVDSSLTPDGLTPPPIHRHLKPCLRRARPPPLDLRGLSTITECPTHLPLTRTSTESRCSFSTSRLPLERRAESGEDPVDDNANGTSLDSRFFPFDGTVTPSRSSNLDYLSLDFNPALPSPLQKKPLLSEEHRVDYVLVDEKKTQALQSTKLEWTDVRQSKT